MSARINTNKKQMASTIKPYCKVCHDAGKTEKEYTSHFVRASPEPNAPVVCPTLLAQPCRFCQQGGHTPAYCPELAKRKKAEEKAAKLKAFEEKKQQQEQSKPAASATKTANAFAALDSDSEDEQPKSKAKKPEEQTFVIKKQQPVAQQQKPVKLKSEEFPALPTKSAKQEQQEQSVKTSSKPAASASFVTALAQCHPGLKVPTKMATDVFVNSNAGRNVIVVNKRQREQREQEAAAAEESEAVGAPYEANVADFYETALEAFNKELERRPKASELDWAALDSDSSDDEDW